MILLVKVR